MPYDLPNDLRLRALGNKEILKISNLGRDIAHLGREIALVVTWEKHFFFVFCFNSGKDETLFQRIGLLLEIAKFIDFNVDLGIV